jgi:hypothetical protein
MRFVQKVLLSVAVVVVCGSSVFALPARVATLQGRACRGAYSETVAASMLEAELDECRSRLSFVDRTARQDRADKSCRTRSD